MDAMANFQTQKAQTTTTKSLQNCGPHRSHWAWANGAGPQTQALSYSERPQQKHALEKSDMSHMEKVCPILGIFGVNWRPRCHHLKLYITFTSLTDLTPIFPPTSPQKLYITMIPTQSRHEFSSSSPPPSPPHPHPILHKLSSSTPPTQSQTGSGAQAKKDPGPRTQARDPGPGPRPERIQA